MEKFQETLNEYLRYPNFDIYILYYWYRGRITYTYIKLYIYIYIYI